jgi:hypothetical protein
MRDRKAILVDVEERWGRLDSINRIRLANIEILLDVRDELIKLNKRL